MPNRTQPWIDPQEDWHGLDRQMTEPESAHIRTTKQIILVDQVDLWGNRTMNYAQTWTELHPEMPVKQVEKRPKLS